MFGVSSDSSFDQIGDFLIGDRHNSHFATWIHFVQCASIATIFCVFMFCGSRTGG